MEYIIDAYNLIKSSFLREHEHSRSMDSARDFLFSILLDYNRKHPSVRFTVVFDGFPPSAGIFLTDRKIRILFSIDITADELIRQLLSKTTDNNRLKTVVSNDRGVQDCGKLFISNVLTVDRFLAIVCPPVRNTTPRVKAAQKNIGDLNKRSIEKELKEFYNNK